MPTQALNTSSVEGIHASHQENLHTLERDRAMPLLHRLHRGRFYIHTDQKRLRGISLTDLVSAYYYSDITTIAEAFVLKTDHPFTESDAFRMLRNFSLLESKNQSGLLKIVDDLTQNKLSEEVIHRGTEAMLKRMTDLHPEMHRSRTGLDILLRECLRLSAAWASHLESRENSSNKINPTSQR